MSPINPIDVSNNLSDRYSTYLQSLVQPSNEHLAAAVERAVQESVETGDGIVKGPFVEATPPFDSGNTLRDLVDEGVLSTEFLELKSPKLPLDRPLYRHQEDAIRKATNGRNLIVATGTGSGKTESFLIPVLDYIMRQKQQGELSAGVRALILYPMNALANDQVARIREVLANYPDITFGRYTGETKPATDVAIEEYKLAHGKAPLQNELVSREQMQESPPHILLTNFAMLEYLLLRPEDSEFFDGAHSGNWKFIVSDEAHVYDGAYGTEVGMLLRKLRERVDQSGSIQTIGTTATIGDDDEEIERFASNFFSNEFAIAGKDPEEKDLVRPTRKKIEEAKWGPMSVAAWAGCDNPGDFLSKSPESEPYNSFLTESSVVTLRNALFDGPMTVKELAGKIFGEESESALEAVVKIVELGSQIKDEQGNSALSARFHLFARATEGVFTCLSESPHAYLARHEECEHCESPVLELAGCRRCGAEHYIGNFVGDRMFSQPSADAKKVYAYPANVAGDSENEDNDYFEDSPSTRKQSEHELLCRDCGKSNSKAASACENCSGSNLFRVRYSESDSACEVCGSRSKNTLRSLESGNDAAAGVLVTELYSSLPQSDDNSRKIMVFSDNRQQAAFFAPYLQESYSKLMWRKSIHEALLWLESSLDEGESIKLFELISPLKQIAQKYGMAAYGEDVHPKEEAARNLYLEAVTTDARISLEGSGLVSFEVDLPQEEQAYSPLVGLGFSAKESRDLIEQLLQIVRKNGVLTAPSPGVDQRSDFFAPRRGPITLRYNDRDQKGKVSSWKPANRKNSVSAYLEKVLAEMDQTEKLPEILEGIFTLLTDVNGKFSGIFSNVSGGNQAAKFQLDHNHLKITSVQRRGHVFQCNLCRTVSSTSVRGICPRYKCDGRLENIPASEVDVKLPMRHYRQVYRDSRIDPLRAEEHTAQLSNDAARKTQQEFIEGKVNILSSSTTFELGVDVGELETVFLRNVPPGVANYLQRAGRAGRRADSAALIVTYAQRKPHDMAKYSDPRSMVAGEMRAPVVKLDNRRIMERHAFSLIFSDYFKATFSSKLPTSGEFFSENPSSHSNSILKHLEDNNASLFARFDRLLPDALASESKQLWNQSTNQFRELVERVQKKISQEIQQLQDLIDQKKSEEEFKAADKLKKYRNTISEKPLINTLSTKNLIPKYGFPVDTVELAPSLGDDKGKDIELDRDLALAIFEYAPGKKVIAKGNTWESVGIQRPRSNEMDLIRKRYMACNACEFYEEKPDAGNEEEYKLCANCGSDDVSNGKYMVPEWGFLARSTTSDFSGQKNKGGWNRSVHIAERGKSIEISGTMTPPGVTANLQTVAKMVVINENKVKFCGSCGAAFDISVKTDKMENHERPYHSVQKCDSFFSIISLGHKYETDIVELDIGWNGISVDREAAQVSLAYAILQGASEGLQIAIDDLDVVIMPKTPTSLKIALVDAVPAGAGFAQMISENLNAVFEAALEKVDECECGEETSCYQCLRTYGNQRDHDQLNRGIAKQALREILKVH